MTSDGATRPHVLAAPGRVIAAGRALTTAFFAASSLYSLVLASAFAYQQFIKPGLFGWLQWSANQYDALHLGAFSLALLTLVSDVQSTRTRTLALAFALGWGVISVLVFVAPFVGVTGRAAPLALAAALLLPIVWLATIDHLACWQRVFGSDRAEVSRQPRILRAGAAASVFVWATYSVIAFTRADWVVMPRSGWAVGAAASLALHGATFAALSWTLAAVVAVARSVRRPVVVEYALVLAFLATFIFCLIDRAVLPALALGGIRPTLVAAGWALAITCAWSGIALRLAAAEARSLTGLELFCLPIIWTGGRRGAWLWAAALPLVASAAIAVALRVDWGFLLQRAGVLAVWLIAWAVMVTLVGVGAPRRDSGSGKGRGDARTLTLAVAVSLALLGATQGLRWLQARSAVPGSAARDLPVFLDQYAAYDASFKTIDDATAARAGTSPEFYRFLSAHSNVRPEVPIDPVPIDLGPAAPRQRPHVFLFVVDSLRPDYLSPYNDAVTFTPGIDALAADALVFRNAFSRYGGTGLALPAIFSGSLLPHRQYVTPFAPMNALAALLEREQYQFAMALDSIMNDLLVPPPRFVALRAGERAMAGDFCTTLEHLGQMIAERPAAAAEPLFGYALPQNLHLAYVLRQPGPSRDYPGFHAPVAGQLERMDGCLKSFLGLLERRGMYDDSIIILTSDHGDSLGEAGRWGHAYAGFPEIFRIPLIVRLPPALASQWTADLDAVSFATDIPATIHALLGGTPASPGRAAPRMFGRPLVHASGADSLDAARRREDFLLASSYGPVYGLLSRNGGRLYVVDAINARDYSFALTRTGSERRTLTAAERAFEQQRVAEQIAEIAAFFGFDPGRAPAPGSSLHPAPPEPR